MRIEPLLMVILILSGARSAVSSEMPTTLVCVAPRENAHADAVGKLCDIVARNLMQRDLRVSHADVAPAAGNQNIVWLVVERLSDRLVSGRLEWRQIGAAQTSIGPQLETVITDSKLNDRALENFVEGLIRESKIKFVADN